MAKNLMILFCCASWFVLTGCNIRTPEIRGVVLDEETKQPVEGAWVSATLAVKTKTVAGDVHAVLSVDPPHTRTDKQGKFIIPLRKFKKPSFPVSFGTEIENFSVNATTVDDKSGGFYLKDYEGKKKIEVTIYVKPWEKGLKDEREYFSYIQSLYNYCLTGRFGVEVPPVEGGCDEWELNYAIAKHERYLERYKDPKLMEQPPYGVSKWDRIHKYSSVLKDLAYLYEKKGDYKKALTLFRKVKEFDERQGSTFSIKEYENQIKKLQQRLQEKE